MQCQPGLGPRDHPGCPMGCLLILSWLFPSLALRRACGIGGWQTWDPRGPEASLTPIPSARFLRVSRGHGAASGTGSRSRFWRWPPAGGETPGSWQGLGSAPPSPSCSPGWGLGLGLHEGSRVVCVLTLIGSVELMSYRANGCLPTGFGLGSTVGR